MRERASERGAIAIITIIISSPTTTERAPPGRAGRTVGRGGAAGGGGGPDRKSYTGACDDGGRQWAGDAAPRYRCTRCTPLCVVRTGPTGCVFSAPSNATSTG